MLMLNNVLRKLIVILLITGLIYYFFNFQEKLYFDNVTTAKTVEPIIIEVVHDGDIQFSRGIASDPVKMAVLQIHNSLKKLVEENNTQAQYDTRIEQRTIQNFVEDGTDIYYFLDHATGTMEQLFVFRATGGKIFKLSLFWKDGECFEAKQSTYD